MRHAETASRVREVFQDVLGRNISADEDIARANEPKWDSLKHIELMFALEEKFGIAFSEEDLENLASLSAIVNRIAAGDAA